MSKAIKKEDVAEVVREITLAVNKIVDALDLSEKNKRSTWIQKFLPEVLKANPGYNVVVCHVAFSSEVWGMKHFGKEDLSGWFGLKNWRYWVLIFKSGTFKLKGDGGWINWGYGGSNCTRDGNTLTFAPSENRSLEDGEDDGVDPEAFDETEEYGPEEDEDEVEFDEERTLDNDEYNYDDEENGISYTLGC